MQLVSKSTLKAKALEYFRKVEETGEEVIITSRGKPVLKLIPYAENSASQLALFRGSVERYDDPTEPVGLEDWEALR